MFWFMAVTQPYNIVCAIHFFPFFPQNAFPTQGTLSYAHVLALEALLAIASDLEPAASSGRGLTTSLQIRNNGKDGSGESKDSSNYGTQINSAGV